MIPGLPPPASSWTLTSTAAAAISYADRGTSAIAASSLLTELGWSESQLGTVQSAFFVGYALTQVAGGLLSEGGGGGGGEEGADDVADGVDDNGPLLQRDGLADVSASGNRSDDSDDDKSTSCKGTAHPPAYRTVLPLSLLLTGLSTLAFPAAATYGGPTLAALDRFCLGLFEGLLLPSAMAGVADLVPTDSNRRATASSVLIAGCYLGSALAYGSAALLFSSTIGGGGGGVVPEPAWPYVFYVNGVLAFLCLAVCRKEFVLPSPGDWLQLPPGAAAKGRVVVADDMQSPSSSMLLLSSIRSLAEDTIEVATATASSVSGRAVLAAQAGQGALLYSIASWGPLYLERVGGVGRVAGADEAAAAAAAATTAAAAAATSTAATSAAAAAAATALILPQITQAIVGVGVGTVADALSVKVGTIPTRRALQGLGGMVPAAILWYLAGTSGGLEGVGVGAGVHASPVALFGAAQTVSALSLGAVSVSHLEIAPRNAGTVYALGNVAAAVSGSVTVNLFGTLLEAGGGSDFGTPFRLVAVLSALGSLVYATTVRDEPEIFVNTDNSSSNRNRNNKSKKNVQMSSSTRSRSTGGGDNSLR